MEFFSSAALAATFPSSRMVHLILNGIPWWMHPLFWMFFAFLGWTARPRSIPQLTFEPFHMPSKVASILLPDEVTHLRAELDSSKRDCRRLTAALETETKKHQRATRQHRNVSGTRLSKANAKLQQARESHRQQLKAVRQDVRLSNAFFDTEINLKNAAIEDLRQYKEGVRESLRRAKNSRDRYVGLSQRAESLIESRVAEALESRGVSPAPAVPAAMTPDVSRAENDRLQGRIRELEALRDLAVFPASEMATLPTDNRDRVEIERLQGRVKQLEALRRPRRRPGPVAPATSTTDADKAEMTRLKELVPPPAVRFVPVLQIASAIPLPESPEAQLQSPVPAASGNSELQVSSAGAPPELSELTRPQSSTPTALDSGETPTFTISPPQKSLGAVQPQFSVSAASDSTAPSVTSQPHTTSDNNEPQTLALKPSVIFQPPQSQQTVPATYGNTDQIEQQINGTVRDEQPSGTAQTQNDVQSEQDGAEDEMDIDSPSRIDRMDVSDSPPRPKVPTPQLPSSRPLIFDFGRADQQQPLFEQPQPTSPPTLFTPETTSTQQGTFGYVFGQTDTPRPRHEQSQTTYELESSRQSQQPNAVDLNDQEMEEQSDVSEPHDQNMSERTAAPEPNDQDTEEQSTAPDLDDRAMRDLSGYWEMDPPAIDWESLEQSIQEGLSYPTDSQSGQGPVATGTSDDTPGANAGIQRGPSPGETLTAVDAPSQFLQEPTSSSQLSAAQPIASVQDQSKKRSREETSDAMYSPGVERSPKQEETQQEVPATSSDLAFAPDTVCIHCGQLFSEPPEDLCHIQVCVFCGWMFSGPHQNSCPFYQAQSDLSPVTETPSAALRYGEEEEYDDTCVLCNAPFLASHDPSCTFYIAPYSATQTAEAFNLETGTAEDEDLNFEDVECDRCDGTMIYHNPLCPLAALPESELGVYPEASSAEPADNSAEASEALYEHPGLWEPGPPAFPAVCPQCAQPNPAIRYYHEDWCTWLPDSPVSKTESPANHDRARSEDEYDRDRSPTPPGSHDDGTFPRAGEDDQPMNVGPVAEKDCFNWNCMAEEGYTHSAECPIAKEMIREAQLAAEKRRLEVRQKMADEIEAARVAREQEAAEAEVRVTQMIKDRAARRAARR